MDAWPNELGRVTQERDQRVTWQNLQIATNVIHAAWKTGVRKLLNLGSSCIYPRNAPQPMNEDTLLTGPLESTINGTNFISAVARPFYLPIRWRYLCL